MNAGYTHTLVRQVAALLAAAMLVGACGGKNPKLVSPWATVERTTYYFETGVARTTGNRNFDETKAWLAAASKISRSLSSQVYNRLTRVEQNQVETIARHQGVQDAAKFIQELVTDNTLRNDQHLGTWIEDDEITVALGIPQATWKDLLDEVAFRTRQMLREGVDLESTSRREWR